jgi:DNA-binding transcriptional ArsR family regulator
MTAELTLALPWVEATPEHLEGLIVRRGRANTLAYSDGITMEVLVLDPGLYGSAEALVGAANERAGPGRVLLIAGAVPLSWRPRLRDVELSFVDVAGVAEINWPRLRVSARRFGKPIKRRRSPVSLQKGHALVVQELLIASVDGEQLTISDLAERAGVSLPTASRATSQLAEHGLVVKEREGHRVWVSIVHRVEVAKRLAERTRWPGAEMLSGFLWGRTVFDTADRISSFADRKQIALAVTGRVGAAYYGVLGTTSPNDVRCWVDVGRHELPDVAEQLGLDPAPDDAANVLLCADPWRVGIHRRSEVMFDEWSASIAHPVRVWCDLHSEQRGSEFAAQLWGTIAHAG